MLHGGNSPQKDKEKKEIFWKNQLLCFLLDAKGVVFVFFSATQTSVV